MRVMVLFKADEDSEAGVMPDEKFLGEMLKYNEDLVKAGVMLAGEGLHPSSRGVRVRFSGGKRTVIDGPFAEAKELVAGFKLASEQEEPDLDAAIDDDIGDDLLRLVFTTCHPVLSTEARVALTLRLLGA